MSRFDGHHYEDGDDGDEDDTDEDDEDGDDVPVSIILFKDILPFILLIGRTPYHHHHHHHNYLSSPTACDPKFGLGTGLRK